MVGGEGKTGLCYSSIIRIFFYIRCSQLYSQQSTSYNFFYLFQIKALIKIRLLRLNSVLSIVDQQWNICLILTEDLNIKFTFIVVFSLFFREKKLDIGK